MEDGKGNHSVKSQTSLKDPSARVRTNRVQTEGTKHWCVMRRGVAWPGHSGEMGGEFITPRSSEGFEYGGPKEEQGG